MAHVTEPLLTRFLWQWLEQQGCVVGGEVDLGNGRVDLVAETSDGEFVGYEVKDQRTFDREKVAGMRPEKVRELMKQLNKYQDSGFLDRLYYCSQEPSPVREWLERGGSDVDVATLNQDLSRGIQPRTDRQRHGIRIPHEVGVMRVPIDEEGDPEEVKPAELRPRINEPTLSQENEAWVRHRVWERAELVCERGSFFPICEAVIPNPDSSTAKRTDVAIFVGDADPTMVLTHQDEEKYDLIGVEAKGAGLGGASQEQLRQRLTAYLVSGGLTQLYLAVLEQDEHAAQEVLGMSGQATFRQFNADSDDTAGGHLSAVGLITVNREGDIAVVRQAENVEMRFDGIQAPDTNQLCKAVGWGKFVELRDPEDFENIFNQEDPIHLKARVINLARDQWQTPLGRAVQKMQSGGMPTERERELIEREYERQFDDSRGSDLSR